MFEFSTNMFQKDNDALLVRRLDRKGGFFGRAAPSGRYSAKSFEPGGGFDVEYACEEEIRTLWAGSGRALHHTTGVGGGKCRRGDRCRSIITEGRKSAGSHLRRLHQAGLAATGNARILPTAEEEARGENALLISSNRLATIPAPNVDAISEDGWKNDRPDCCGHGNGARRLCDEVLYAAG